jgi:hypothetical protein
MKHIFAIALLVGIAGIAGCAQIQSKLNQDVQTATVPDLQAAVAEAQAAGDQDGAACLTDVLNYVQALPSVSSSAPPVNVVGAASALEAARIGAASLSTGFVIPPIPHQLHKDCAVLVIDAEQLAAKFGIGAAALAKGGGVLKAAKTLQAMQAAHP